MKNFDKLFVAILMGIAISGCSSTPSKPDDCGQITVTALLPPVVVDLDYKDINGSRNQVVVQGGFQHALAIPGLKTANGGAITTPLRPPEKAITRSETILFEFDHYSIPAHERDRLTRFLREINTPKLMHVQVEGHTDSWGPANYNRALSIRRAQAVRGYLVQHGIEASKVSIEGFGKELPIAPNNTDAGRAKNRRAVITPLSGY